MTQPRPLFVDTNAFVAVFDEDSSEMEDRSEPSVDIYSDALLLLDAL